jgi:hypothetical protein
MPLLGAGSATGPGKVIAQEVTFTEVSNTGGVYTASVTVPQNSWIIDIKVYGQAVWTASGTSAVLKVGDGIDDDGWFIGINVKATDLAANEVLSLGAGGTGGKPGAYYVAASGLKKTQWSPLERVITGKITTVTTAGNVAGRTRMLVMFTTQSDAVEATFA